MPKQGFQKGQSGNPAGRPPGARTKARLLAEAILESNRDDIINAVVAAAKDRDPTAMKICADRLLPLRKGATVTFNLPAIKTAADVVAAIGTVAEEMACGELTPDEASAVAGVLEIKRRAIETCDIEGRLRKVEEAQASGPK
jgi:hypothetical protein